MADVPREKIAFIGRLTSAALVMLLWSIRLPSFPVVVPVLNKTIPLPYPGMFGIICEPLSVQYFTVLLDASLIKRMVDVPTVADVLALDMVRLTDEPVAFTLPSMVTLSAPFRSIRGVARLPLMLSPVVVGYIFMDV